MAIVKKIDLTDALEKSLSKYYAKLILDRAFPDVRDGLKPVQRRILYVMDRDGVSSNKRFVKSMRVTGNVSSIHPHGDCYDSVANLIAAYNIMQPLVEGHGGFKNIIGKESSAPRYTEVRLNKFSERYMLKNVSKKISPFKPDFDQSGLEPEVLPAKLPLLLLNGVNSIGGGGFSSYFPPHNFHAVKSYMCDLIDHPDKDGKALIRDNNFYPDFPTGGIMDKTGIEDIYEGSQSGNFRVYAKLELDTDSNPKRDIIRVLELPYGTTLDNDIIEPLVALTKGKTSPDSKTINKDLKEEFSVIKDLENRSKDGKYIDLSILVSKGTDLKALVNKLNKRLKGFRNTIIVNKNFLNGGRLVSYKSVKDVATDWLTFRRQVVINEKMIEIREIERRISIIDATNLVIGNDANRQRYLDIANSSKNKADLAKRLLEEWSHLNEIQVDFLTNLRIYNISKDDLAGFAQELKDLQAKKEATIKYFKNPKMIDDLIKADLEEIEESGLLEERIYHTTYQVGVDTETTKDEVPEENFLMVVSGEGYVKKTKSETSTVQKRSGKGRSLGRFRQGDYPKDVIEVSSKDTLLFLTSAGNIFKIEAMDIPAVTSLNNLGVSIKKKLKGQQFTKMISLKDGMLDNPNLAFLIVTKKNRIKLTSVTSAKNINKAGLRLANLVDDEDEVVFADLVDLTKDFTVVATNNLGKVVNIPKDELPLVGRTAAGVKVFAKSKSDVNEAEVVSVSVAKEDDDTVIFVTKEGRGKLVQLDKFPVTGRNKVGLVGIKLKDGDSLASVNLISSSKLSDRNLLVVSNTKSINLPVDSINYYDRQAQGVTIKKNDDDEYIITTTLVEN